MSEKNDQRRIYGSATVGERGQVVIPKKARIEADIQPGDTLMVLGNGSSGIIMVKADSLNDLLEQLELAKQDS